MTLVNAYYNVSTALYEWGWGHSFHFAPRKNYESFMASILRHEVTLAHRLRLQKGEKIMDVGCGIGGPLRNIAQVTGAYISGINNNDYQIKRGQEENKKVGLDKTCEFLKEDFCQMTGINDNSFDKAYAIEATCHAPKRELVYGNVFRTLKPGGLFGCYEWCLTEKYNEKDEQHKRIKKWIEEGDALPDIIKPNGIIEALKSVGFEVIEHYDVIERDKQPNDIPWYQPIKPSFFPPQNIHHSHYGQIICWKMLNILETLRIAPKGVEKVSRMLMRGADGLVEGGEREIFTPAYYFLARKPLK